MDKCLMEFSGRQDRIYKEKLPEEFGQTDQNAWHRKRAIWTPRQGLARPQGIGLAAQRIDSIGYGEVGIKTGLLIEHGGSIDGYAIGVNDVTPVWTPPPARDWYYEAPTLTVEQTGDGEVTLTPSSTVSYTISYNFYRDGVLIGSGTTLVDTPGAGTFEYTAEAETETGVQSGRSTGTKITVFGQYISDDFNRADGAVGGDWTPFLGLDMKIESQRVRPVGASTGDEYHSTGFKVPLTFRMNYIRTTNLTAQGGWGFRLHPTAGFGGPPTGMLWYDPTFAGGVGRWWLQANPNTSEISAFQLGAPDATGTITVSIDASGQMTVSASGLSYTNTGSTVNIANTFQPAMQINTTPDGAIMFVDNVACGGVAP
jgi:hypothetical protein